jgi:hypothetical protein
MINQKLRSEAISVLEGHLPKDIPSSKVLKLLPDYGDDELLESVINSYSEPLRDIGAPSWEEFTKTCITALQEDWSLEKFDNAF